MMTRRERIMAALSHNEPEGVPIDLGSTRDSGVVVEGYERLKQSFGVASKNRLISRMMRNVEMDERILEHLDIDTRGVFPLVPPDSITGENRYKDEGGIERVRPLSSFYYDQIEFPLAGAVVVDDIVKYSCQALTILYEERTQRVCGTAQA